MQSSSSALPIVFLGIVILLIIALVIYFFAGLWKVFVKAGEPGWKALIPFYSGWTLSKIGSRPGWLGLLTFVSFSVKSDSFKHISTPLLIAVISFGIVSFTLQVIIGLGVAKNFGRSKAFGIILLAMLPYLGYPILGYGKSQYLRGMSGVPSMPSPAQQFPSA